MSGPGLNLKVEGVSFEYVCDITPESGSNGVPIEYMPQSEYENKSNLSLHKYGYGPFCRFKIPRQSHGTRGIYIICLNGKPYYVGECEDLEKRYNMGYGNISPRNCYKGGQQTNCRINNLVLKKSKNGSKIQLFFYKTKDRINLESELINKLNPDWNRSSGKKTYNRGDRSFSPNTQSRKKGKWIIGGKYLPLKEYLKKVSRTKNKVSLSFDKIEEIIEAKLPASARKHRAWWSNGGHPHCSAWLDAGWRVSLVELGSYVDFIRWEVYVAGPGYIDYVFPG